MDTNLKPWLDQKLAEYNQPRFIQDDPISVPHRFSRAQDIEIAGFFAAVFAWGQRTTIIAKATELMQRMDNAPYDFILNHEAEDLKSLLGFRHRTFNEDDLLYFVAFFRRHYSRYSSLEDAFLRHENPGQDMFQALNAFKEWFFDDVHLPRTRKHISSPAQKSACKRLNMFLRWMVRQDNYGVDFGIWKRISPASLIMPLDLHVARVARRKGLLIRKQNDWQAAVELTEACRQMDPSDPVKYDFSLFALGVIERW